MFADYIDSAGAIRETFNFNIRKNNNNTTNDNKVRQRGADTIQSLTELTKNDVNERWDPNVSTWNWFFVNTEIQFTNGNGKSVKKVANEATFTITAENWDKDTEAITNRVTGSETVSKN